ncbi:hypothetical protein pb186bvf_016656 [Paramecium bursaria]
MVDTLKQVEDKMVYMQEELKLAIQKQYPSQTQRELEERIIVYQQELDLQRNKYAGYEREIQSLKQSLSFTTNQKTQLETSILALKTLLMKHTESNELVIMAENIIQRGIQTQIDFTNLKQQFNSLEQQSKIYQNQLETNEAISKRQIKDRDDQIQLLNEQLKQQYKEIDTLRQSRTSAEQSLTYLKTMLSKHTEQDQIQVMAEKFLQKYLALQTQSTQSDQQIKLLQNQLQQQENTSKRILKENQDQISSLNEEIKRQFKEIESLKQSRTTSEQQLTYIKTLLSRHIEQDQTQVMIEKFIQKYLTMQTQFNQSDAQIRLLQNQIQAQESTQKRILKERDDQISLLNDQIKSAFKEIESLKQSKIIIEREAIAKNMELIQEVGFLQKQYLKLDQLIEILTTQLKFYKSANDSPNKDPRDSFDLFSTLKSVNEESFGIDETIFEKSNLTKFINDVPKGTTRSSVEELINKRQYPQQFQDKFLQQISDIVSIPSGQNNLFLALGYIYLRNLMTGNQYQYYDSIIQILGTQIQVNVNRVPQLKPEYSNQLVCFFVCELNELRRRDDKLTDIVTNLQQNYLFSTILVIYIKCLLYKLNPQQDELLEWNRQPRNYEILLNSVANNFKLFIKVIGLRDLQVTSYGNLNFAQQYLIKNIDNFDVGIQNIQTVQKYSDVRQFTESLIDTFSLFDYKIFDKDKVITVQYINSQGNSFFHVLGQIYFRNKSFLISNMYKDLDKIGDFKIMVKNEIIKFAKIEFGSYLRTLMGERDSYQQSVLLTIFVRNWLAQEFGDSSYLQFGEFNGNHQIIKQVSQSWGCQINLYRDEVQEIKQNNGLKEYTIYIRNGSYGLKL